MIANNDSCIIYKFKQEAFCTYIINLCRFYNYPNTHETPIGIPHYIQYNVMMLQNMTMMMKYY